MAYIFGQFPLIGDFRFTPVDTEISPNFKVGGIPTFDEYLYNDPLNQEYWQLNRPYYVLKAPNDLCQVYVQTPRVGSSPFYPTLELIDECETVAVSLAFYVNGAQRITGNSFTIPGTSTDIPLDSFSWKFTMGLLRDIATQAGFYKLRMTIYGDEAMTTSKVYESELIQFYDSFPATAVIQSSYPTNNAREGIITGGWTDGQNLTFTSRVPCSITEFNLQGIKVGYLQQSYLELMQLDESWRTWIFDLGGAVGAGVPNWVFEQVDKHFGTRNFTINGKSYSLYENSDTPKMSWSKDDPITAGLIHAKIPIRERYLGQNVFVFQNPTPDLTIFTLGGYPRGVTGWILSASSSSWIMPPAVIDDLAEFEAYRDTLNAIGVGGTFYITGTTLKFTPTIIGASVFLSPEILSIKFNPSFTGSGLGDVGGFRMRGFAAPMVIDWGDGTAAESYSFPDFSNHVITHSFGAGAGFNTRIFHADNIVSLEFIETGSIYPVSGANLVDITGDLPAGLVGLDIAACPQFASIGGASNIDITPCVSLQILSFRSNPLLNSFTTPLFSTLLTYPALSYLEFKNNPFNSTQTDLLFNNFVNNAWDGVLAGGDFIVQNAPAVAPTAASLTSRNALIAESWSVLADP